MKDINNWQFTGSHHILAAGLAASLAALAPTPGRASSIGPGESAPSAQSEVERSRPNPRTQYIGGGVVGTTLGFGLGHVIAGEYGRIGWVFTVGELVALATVAAGYWVYMRDLFMFSECSTFMCSYGEPSRESTALLGVGTVALIGLRVWEAADLWTRPLREGEPTGSSPRVGVAPVVTPTGGAGAMLFVAF